MYKKTERETTCSHLGALLWVQSHCYHPGKTLDDSVSICDTSGTPWPRSIEFLFSHSLPWIRIELEERRTDREDTILFPSSSFSFPPPFPSENPFSNARESDSRDKQSTLRWLYFFFVRKMGTATWLLACSTFAFCEFHSWILVE